jgi:microcompartment protein CcmK/EutM
MLLAKVTGSIVATRKESSMDGLKFLLLNQLDGAGKETGASLVAVDAVGAGVGEVVMYASGSSARQTLETENRPCDAVIMAIVDQWDVNGKVQYRKQENRVS